MVFPEASASKNVRVMVFTKGQDISCSLSEKLTEGEGSQLSVIVGCPVHSGDVEDPQLTIISSGQSATGGESSLAVMVIIAVAV